MGKAKKGRKGAKDNEGDSDLEVEPQAEVEKKIVKIEKDKGSAKTDLENENNSKPSKKIEGKKSSKGKKNKKAESEDNSDVDEHMTKVASGFALLQVDSGPESQENSDEDIVQKDNKKGVKNSESENRTKEMGSKKGKKNRKKRNESDEDIEKVLAELEMEYSGGKREVTEVKAKEEPEEIVEEKKTKIKTRKLKESSIEHNEKKELEQNVDAEEKIKQDTMEDSTIKTAAQKKKEKKEREKQKKMSSKKQDVGIKKTEVEAETIPTEDKTEETGKKKATVNEDVKTDDVDVVEDDEDDKDAKKKKKKPATKEEKDAKAVKGPGKKTIAAMQEALKKIRDEEERLIQEEEERLKREDEAETQRLEQLKLEQDRKERKKQKERERKERLKAEGKLLTAKQKADRARAQAMIDALKAQGIEMPDVGEKRARPSTRIRPNKLKQQVSTEKAEPITTEVKPELNIEVQIVEPPIEIKPEETPEDDVKDSWDVDSSEEEENSEENDQSQTAAPVKDSKTQDGDEESSDNDADDSEDEDETEESEDEQDNRTDAEKKRERAKTRILQRREDAEKNKTLENLRASVVCVLGHVDTGKTKILDKLRRTNVQDGEAGGITQQIGATNVPMENIKEQIKYVKGFAEMQLKIPGLLIIDTPGHESFSNLRSRGSSLCDIAILVVDIMHGLEPQTIESLNLLKNRRTPFIVALNKVDRLYDWQTMNRKDVRDIVKGQASNTQLEFEQRTKEVIVQFAEQGLNAALFYDNPDPKTYVSLIPTSAVTGEGMGNLLALIVDSCQNMLAKRLMYSEELQATVLEVKAIPGLGTTIDCILVNGTLREGDTMIVAGTDGPIVTTIRSLLMPQPMRELRVKNAYIEYKEIRAAQGVKIAAKELEKAIAGLNLLVAQKPDEVEICREEVARELKKALSSIKLQERGVYVQASTLGSLEALLEFLRASKIPYSGIRIGPVVKKDVMKASIMLEHDSQYATILAFDVKIERDAQDLADSLSVKIFQADIIYHLFDKFMAYREELKARKRAEFKNIAVFPCKLRVLPQFIFNSRDPIVMGVMVEAGIVKEGTPICVPTREFVELGIVTSIENNHKMVESARKGQEVCIKIESTSGDAPKMFGRHFDEKDFLVSKITRQSIDACKDYFRDDLIKTDWQLMVELKKQFQIL